SGEDDADVRACGGRCGRCRHQAFRQDRRGCCARATSHLLAEHGTTEVVCCSRYAVRRWRGPAVVVLGGRYALRRWRGPAVVVLGGRYAVRRWRGPAVVVLGGRYAVRR